MTSSLPRFARKVARSAGLVSHGSAARARSTQQHAIEAAVAVRARISRAEEVSSGEQAARGLAERRQGAMAAVAAHVCMVHDG